jgi:hypothetical protein
MVESNPTLFRLLNGDVVTVELRRKILCLLCYLLFYSSKFIYPDSYSCKLGFHMCFVKLCIYHDP